MALIANRDVDYYVDQELRSFELAPAAHVYKGALVGLGSDGYAHGLVAGDTFVGIAYEEMDNTSGSYGRRSVRVHTLGDFGHALAGATIADVGRPVFASMDDTLTLSSDGNSYVGIVVNLIMGGEVMVRLDALCENARRARRRRRFT